MFNITVWGNSPQPAHWAGNADRMALEAVKGGAVTLRQVHSKDKGTIHGAKI